MSLGILTIIQNTKQQFDKKKSTMYITQSIIDLDGIKKHSIQILY